MRVPSMELSCVEQLELGQEGVLDNVDTLDVRRCDLPGAGSASEGCRALRTGSSRVVHGRSVLRCQVLGVRRRDMGAQPRGHRSRNRRRPALPQRRARPDRAGRSIIKVSAPSFPKTFHRRSLASNPASVEWPNSRRLRPEWSRPCPIGWATSRIGRPRRVHWLCISPRFEGDARHGQSRQSVQRRPIRRRIAPRR